MIDLKSVLKKYSHLTIQDKAHIFIRTITVPWNLILSNFPSGHTLIDVGCGHGLFINLLSSTQHGFNQYIGVDADAGKIAVARQIENNNISFYNIDIFHFEKSADVYSFFDVLYLIPYDIQEKLINHIFRKLPEGGYLVIKEIGTKPSWKFTLNRLQETLSVKIFKITLGENFYFRSEEEYRNLLEDIGFVVKVNKIDKGYLHPHILYICKKQ
jgi:SAM-dependent methyltransferase